MIFQVGSGTTIPSPDLSIGSWGGDQTDKISDNFFFIFLVFNLFYRGSTIASREGVIKYVETLQGFFLMDSS